MSIDTVAVQIKGTEMMNELCRLCLDGNLENPVSIYSPKSLNGSQTTITIAELIENFINVKVNIVNYICATPKIKFYF